MQRMKAAVFKSSVDIQPEWTMLDQIPFTSFSKLTYSVGEPEDLVLCGALENYDKMYDRVTPKSEKRLERFKNPSKPQLRIYEVPNDAFENDYVEEPLPEEEQVPPPADEETAAKLNEEKDADVDVQEWKQALEIFLFRLYRRFSFVILAFIWMSTR
ncbi:hypothetical protein SUGI_0960550 [Cryptomeria japonica]|nr:hypothetical protein SUGI_0960550 [Cryptomeria japonica]